MVQAATYGKAILFTSSLGIALCVYAFVVEERRSQDAKYEAVCDLGESMSCSRVLTSHFAKGFGIVQHILGEDSPLNVPNSIPGGAAYALFALLGLVQKSWAAKIQIGLGILTVIASIYLACILYFVLQDFCIICVSTYAINFLNLLLAYLRLRALTPKQAGKQKGQQKSQKAQQQQQQQKKQQQQQKSPQAEKKKQDKQKSPQPEKQKQKQEKSPQPEKQKQNQNQNQQNGKVKNQQNDKQKSPKTPNSKKKNN